MTDDDNGKVIFKWIMDNKQKKRSIQSYINKLHIDYIATRPGVDFEDSEHGLFGYMKNTENVEDIKLQNIEKYVQGISNQNVKIIKTIISLREEDAVEKETYIRNLQKILNFVELYHLDNIYLRKDD